MSFLEKVFFFLVFLFQQSCSSAYFLTQAVEGQFRIWQKEVSFKKALQNPKLPRTWKKYLIELPRIKAFAKKSGLSVNSNYNQFVFWDREAVVWVVTACPEFSFQPKTWSWPLLGTFPYLGWFSKEDAVLFAKSLKKQNYEVYVRGAGAYSTLGWFSDPLISTMLPRKAHAIGAVAEIIFHESVHATIFIENQIPFNESLASFVSEKLTKKYLKKYYGKESLELKEYSSRLKTEKFLSKKFHQAYLDLSKVYRSKKDVVEKKRLKRGILKKLAQETSYPEKVLNNAFLIEYRFYESGQKKFEKLWNSCGGMRMFSVLDRVLTKRQDYLFHKKNEMNFMKNIFNYIYLFCKKHN